MCLMSFLIRAIVTHTHVHAHKYNRKDLMDPPCTLLFHITGLIMDVEKTLDDLDIISLFSHSYDVTFSKNQNCGSHARICHIYVT